MYHRLFSAVDLFPEYKVELRIRNHNTLSRPTLIQHIAQSVPVAHTVSLENPEIFILAEVFKVLFFSTPRESNC